MKDFEASQRMKVMEENVQWFEDHSSIRDEHKKENVTGVTYKVVNVIGEAGDASPSTPIGVNLPNADWIRAEHGSKSVSLGNIVEAYGEASGGTLLNEFAFDQEEIDRAKKYGDIGSKLHTALHEVVGHASGKLNPGIGTPKETLKNYASALEEARADLVALYYLMNTKMIDLGLMETLEVGKAEYDGYIRNGLMTQLQRLKVGDNIEESHMRNRQLVAAWVYEKGKVNNVIEKIERDGKTYFKIRDYVALQGLFGDLLKEIQRIKSEGDYKAGKALIENYAVNVDQAIHTEVLERVKPLNLAPYSGFVNPVLVPEMDEEGKITDIKATYTSSFKDQMLAYGKAYSFLK
jgi:dipeptidyl-peptidase-3